MGGETPSGHHSSQPAARAPNASHPGNAHTTAQSSRSPRHEWYSGSSSSDEWGPHTPTPQQPQARNRSSCSRKLEKESSRTLQVMKTFTSWKISSDGDPKASRGKAKKLASTERNELADNVAVLKIKGNAKESGTKPTESAAGAPTPPPASDGQKGKDRGRRGGEKNATEASHGGSAEAAAVATSTPKPASTAAPKPPTPAPPPPTPSMAPWGFPWAFPPYPYWQMLGMPGTPGAPRNRRPADAESNAKRQEQ
ncbi:hypothetical protein QAD02_013672 [Eretmocerus hayati]|uniref:Uncharacterized protein n=1 Tax=Eretmocerus hayati TaxID=131215 RepID=A0ACC2P3B5_9HYME|nr:hypothetical protein QAD02_013672 [Eretmocerus hayati]